MNFINTVSLLICVASIACGQILFKLASRSIQPGAGLMAIFLSPYLIVGIALYGITTLAWVWLLSKLELTRAYPFMALNFVLVPLLGTLFLGEHVGPRYWAGIALIIGGLLLTLPVASR